MELLRDADAKLTGSWFGFRKDPDAAILLYNRAAKEFAAKNEWNEAGNAWIKAADVEHSQGGSMLSAMTNASNAFFRANNGEKFLTCLEALVSIYTLLEHWERVGETFAQIGEFNSEKENWEKAVEAFEKAIEHFKLSGVNQVKCTKKLAKALARSKKYEQARKVWSKLSGREAEFGRVLCDMMLDDLKKVKETISFQVKEKELLSILVRAIETKNRQLFRTCQENYYLDDWHVVTLKDVEEKFLN